MAMTAILNISKSKNMQKLNFSAQNLEKDKIYEAKIEDYQDLEREKIECSGDFCILCSSYAIPSKGEDLDTRGVSDF